MSTQQQARALMLRHHQLVKNRQQSMLSRTAAEIGMDVETESCTTVQGKPQAGFRVTYDRSRAALS
ncbi:MAG: hypothetical protein RLZZ568_676 [Cyanobacteriota bacterium]|jgi:hypothetical protein